MLGRLLTLLLVVAFIGPIAAAFAVAPVEALEAWPVWCLTLVPSSMVLISATIFRTYRPLLAAPHALSAGAWLVKTIDRLGRVGMSVGVSERSGVSFHHPASRTIALAGTVHDEHTARAYATAAHELGHALFHNERPRLSLVLLASRGHASNFYFYGVALLFGTVLADVPSLRWVAFALVAAAVVLQALVVADETIASAMAGDLLRDHLEDAEQVSAARNHLRRALATYASLLVAYLVPLAAAPWILRGVGGVVPPGDALTGVADTVADIGAIIAVLGAVGAIVYVVVPERGKLGLLFTLLAIIWTPLFAVLVSDQPHMRGWAVALATVPAWMTLATPALVVLRWFGSTLTTEHDSLPWPIPAPGAIRRGQGASPLGRVSMKKLAAKEEPDGPLQRASTYALCLWVVPLAVTWLGWL